MYVLKFKQAELLKNRICMNTAIRLVHYPIRLKLEVDSQYLVTLSPSCIKYEEELQIIDLDIYGLSEIHGLSEKKTFIQ